MNAGLQLIVETPRGGDAGHRFLVSSSEMGELEIARVAAEASRSPVGESYLSVTRPVRQMLKGGTVREGSERIILCNVDVSRLEPADIDAALRHLAGLYAPLETLASAIDWRTSQHSMRIVHPELGKWVGQPEFRLLPPALPRSHSSQMTPAASSATGHSLANRAVKYSIAIGAIVVGLAVWMSWRSGKTPLPPTPPKVFVSRELEELAKEWDCNPAELRISLQRATDWDRRHQERSKGEVLEYLGQINAASPPDSFFMTSSAEIDRDFQQKFMPRANSIQEARALRMWLYDAWLEFEKLKESAILAKASLEKVSKKERDEFAEFILRISDRSSDFNADDFQEPKTPLFDRQDVQVHELLKTILVDLNATGVSRKLLAGNEEDLLPFLIALKKNSKNIDEIVTRRMYVVDKIADYKQGKAMAVKAAYVSLEAFLRHLSSFPDPPPNSSARP